MSVATFTTSMGTFKAELYTTQMPITWYVKVSERRPCPPKCFGSSMMSGMLHSIDHISLKRFFLFYSGNFIDLANSGYYDGIVSCPSVTACQNHSIGILAMVAWQLT